MYILYVLLYITYVKCESGHSSPININTVNKTWKDTNTELNVRPRIKDSPTYLYPGGESSTDAFDCCKPAKCIQMRNNTCMGVRLPYNTTTLDFVPDHMTLDDIEEKLHLLQSLRHIPKCWSDVHPFLCSIFMPKCINDTADLPSHEICKKVSGSCRMLFNHTLWPSFIKCENPKLFPTQERQKEKPWWKKEPQKKEPTFNITGQCLKPLVPTDDTLAYFEDVDGCGVSCSDPLYYTNDEQLQIQSFIAWAAGICFCFNLFTVVTFLIDWRNANKYPAVVIFYINCCFIMSCIGWLVQFLSTESRDNIVCRKDGTLKTNGPTGGNISCAAVFMLVYVSLMAAMVWFAILAYAWHMSFQALGKIQDRIDKKGAYFHLIAWCLPLVLAVIVMAIAEVDGNSMTGICFVGYVNHTARIWFLLVPLSIVMLVGMYFLLRGLITLIRLKISSQEIISERASAKIRETIVRMGLFSVFSCAAVAVTFYCHIYEFQNSWKWKQNFKDYMFCSITTKYADVSECKMEFRPSVAKLQLHLLSPFFAGILMSSWVWTGSTVDTWKRFFRRTSNCEAEEPIKLKKHKVIAQAFAKRKIFNDAGRLSISFRNTHKDPVGLNIDLNSVTSQDFSSTWAAALPKLVMRRDALPGVTTGSVSSNRRNSVDSEISFSVRRVSVESRRNSFDSQMSVKIAELKTTTRKVLSTRNACHVRRKKRNEYGISRSEKVGPLFRRGSNTSQESQLGAQILSALTIGGTSNVSALPVPNMKRRSAIGDGVEDRILIAKMLDEKGADRLLYNCDSDENLSSEEKDNNKDIDIEAGNIEKDERDNDSDNEDSQPEEETKMLEQADEEEPLERCRSKSSNKSTRSHESRKYILDETMLKQLLQKSSIEDKMKSENELKDSYKKTAMGDLASTLTSYCPELMRIMQSDGQTSAREIATQTSLPLDILEMEEANQSIYELINSRSSKGTQISPQLKKFKKTQK